MGHSQLCNYDARWISGTKEYQVGCQSIRQAVQWIKTDNLSVNGFVIDKIILWPQTARAKKQTQGHDFIVIDNDGIKRANVQEF